MEKILRVNSKTGECVYHTANEEQRKWGGRGFIAHILTTEVPPICEPLGRFNKFIVSMGLLADTPVSTAGQISVGGKSPLTGGIKESNSGGHAGKRIARLGIKAIIIEDIPDAEYTRVLFINKDGARLDDVPELRHKWVSDTILFLRERYGEKIGIICNGPAGEMLMHGAGVASPTDDDVQCRYAARGGLGALLGSKGVKAIVVDDAGAQPSKPVKPEVLKETIAAINALVREDPKSKNRKLYGTIDILEMANQIGIMPTRNFSSGSFEHAENWIATAFSGTIEERGGDGASGTPCVKGCTIQCSNVWPDKRGKKLCGSVQYETVALCGSNLGIANLDDVAKINDLCNQVGVDTIETGAAIGVAMASGVLDFGDAEKTRDIIRQIGEGTYLGRIIGNGCVFTGQAFGNIHVPAVKKQAMPAYDPRSLKGNGVTYLTSTMGADHTSGNSFETARTTNPLGIEKHVQNVRNLQIRAVILDTLGVCLFLRPPFVKEPALVGKLLEGRYGWPMDIKDIKDMSNKILNMERFFNEEAGVSEKFFDIPEFMRFEPLPPNNSVFDVPHEDMMAIWDIPVNYDVF